MGNEQSHPTSTSTTQAQDLATSSRAQKDQGTDMMNSPADGANALRSPSQERHVPGAFNDGQQQYSSRQTSGRPYDNTAVKINGAQGNEIGANVMSSLPTGNPRSLVYPVPKIPQKRQHSDIQRSPPDASTSGPRLDQTFRRDHDLTPESTRRNARSSPIRERAHDALRGDYWKPGDGSRRDGQPSGRWRYRSPSPMRRTSDYRDPISPPQRRRNPSLSSPFRPSTADSGCNSVSLESGDRLPVFKNLQWKNPDRRHSTQQNPSGAPSGRPPVTNDEHQSRVDFEGLKDVPTGPKSVAKNSITRPDMTPGTAAPSPSSGAKNQSMSPRVTIPPSAPSADLAPVTVSDSVRRAPHAFIPASSVPPKPRTVHHIKGYLQRYGPKEVHVDQKGYYVVFPDDSAGLRRLQQCVIERTGELLFSMYTVYMEPYPHGQPTCTEPPSQVTPGHTSLSATPTQSHAARTALAASVPTKQNGAAEVTRSSPIQGGRVLSHASTARLETSTATNDCRDSSSRPVPHSSPLRIPSRQGGDDGSSVSGRTNSSDLSISKRHKCHSCHQLPADYEEALVQCSSCPKRYHRRCHPTPPIPRDLGDDHTWQCLRCVKKQVPVPERRSVATTTAASVTATSTDDGDKRPGGMLSVVVRPDYDAAVVIPPSDAGIVTTTSAPQVSQRSENPATQSEDGPKKSLQVVPSNEPGPALLVAASHSHTELHVPGKPKQPSEDDQDGPGAHRPVRDATPPHSDDSQFGEANDLVKQSFTAVPEPNGTACRTAGTPLKLQLKRTKVPRSQETAAAQQTAHPAAIAMPEPRIKTMTATDGANGADAMPNEESSTGLSTLHARYPPEIPESPLTIVRDRAGSLSESPAPVAKAKRTGPRKIRSCTNCSTGQLIGYADAVVALCMACKNAKKAALEAANTNAHGETKLDARRTSVQEAPQEPDESTVLEKARSTIASEPSTTDAAQGSDMAIASHSEATKVTSNEMIDGVMEPNTSASNNDQPQQNVTAEDAPVPATNTLTSAAVAARLRLNHDIEDTDTLSPPPSDLSDDDTGSDDRTPTPRPRKRRRRGRTSGLLLANSLNDSRHTPEVAATKPKKRFILGGEGRTFKEIVEFALAAAKDHRLQTRGIFDWVSVNVIDSLNDRETCMSGLGATLSSHEGIRGKQAWTKVNWEEGDSDKLGMGCWWVLKSDIADTLPQWDPALKESVSPMRRHEDVVNEDDDTDEEPLRKRRRNKSTTAGNSPEASASKRMSGRKVVKLKLAKKKRSREALLDDALSTTQVDRDNTDSVSGQAETPGHEASRGIDTEEPAEAESSDDEPLSKICSAKQGRVVPPPAMMQMPTELAEVSSAKDTMPTEELAAGWDQRRDQLTRSPISGGMPALQEKTTAATKKSQQPACDRTTLPVDSPFGAPVDEAEQMELDDAQQYPRTIPEVHFERLPEQNPKRDVKHRGMAIPGNHSLAQRIKYDAGNIDYTAKSLFTEWPEYDPKNRFDKAAKLEDIKKRPTRKQMFKKPAMYSRLASNENTTPLRALKTAASDHHHDPTGRSSTIRSPRKASFFAQPAAEEHVVMCDTVEELFDMPEDLVPFIHKQQLAFREGVRSEEGRPTRVKVVYTTGFA